MDIIEVQLAARSYEVRIAHGILANFARKTAPFLRKERAVIVSDRNVATHWRARIDASLKAEGKAADWHIVEPGEGAKSWQGLEALTSWLLEREVERSDHIFALGGGVVGDLAGFAAAILKRGCGFVQIPTTLLAQVDSSVGGKTAINTPAGKNLIGAFHQPACVLIDPAVLDTLDEREMRAGFAEVLKYGILGDTAFFAWLEENSTQLLNREQGALTHAIEQSIKIKARIVAADERETKGARALLNLGHTFGHALEAQTGYSQKLLHGEAVALGMVLAAHYSARRGLIGEDVAERIKRAIASAGLPVRLSELELGCGGDALSAHMLHDKKREGGKLPFVLLENLGAAFLARDVELADVAQFLDQHLKE